MKSGTDLSFQVSGSASRHCIEEGVRLSESVLWTLQTSYFAEQGERAWSDGQVPYYVTSNAFLANAYATAAFGFLRDAHAAGADFVRIVEIGAGIGRLAFHFLRRLTTLYRGSALDGRITFKYVMTDASERTIGYWKTHSSLREFADAGLLEFKQCDIENPAHLELSGDDEPVVLIANYVFDSVRADAFRVRQGKLLELLVRLEGTEPPALDNVAVTYLERETSTEYYAEALFNGILATYADRLGSTAFTFPIAALRCLQQMQAQTSGSLVILTADHGQMAEEELLDCEEPFLLRHGSVSLGVNYHALNRWAADTGGEVLVASHAHRRLAVCAWLWNRGTDCIETRHACGTVLEPFGADDFFTLKEAVEAHIHNISGEQILAYLRLSRYDSRAFSNCLPALLEIVPNCAPAFEVKVLQLVNRVWDEYFAIGEEEDLAASIGALLLRMRRRVEALEFSERSVELYGRRTATLIQMAQCRWEMRDTDVARALIAEVLTHDPGHDTARQLLVRIEAAEQSLRASQSTM